MKSKLITNTISTLRIITISSLTIFTLYTVQAWVGPTLSAPNGNVAGPITTSATNQTKTGNLTVGKLCLSGVCNATWPSDAVTSVNGQTGVVNITVPSSADFLTAATSTQIKTGSLGVLDNFSIGNTLIVNGGFRFATTSAGAGKVLMSDANGVATWQYPQASGGVTSITAGSGITVSPTSGTGVVTVSSTGGSLTSYNNLPTGAIAGFCGYGGSILPSIGSGASCSCVAGWILVTLGTYLVGDGMVYTQMACVKK